MPEHQVTLTVQGRRYEGWKSVRIQRGVEQIAGTFSLDVTEKSPKQPERREIHAGDRCSLAIDGVVIITGWIDDIENGYDTEQHTIRVSGRDAAGDLVDCSAVHKPGEWHDRTMAQIAAELCGPFGVKVRSATDVGKAFSDFTLQKGEAVFEAIKRMGKARGVLAISDGLGGVVLTRSGTERVPAELVEGENIKAAEAKVSFRERFSEYHITGQAPGKEWGTPEEASEMSALATDKAIGRYRPLLIVTDQGEGMSYGDRANYEARVRAAKSIGGEVTVQGWGHRSGLWHPNRIVPVRAPLAGMVGDRLIASVEFSLKEKEGTLTKLTLVGPGAFEVLAIPDVKAW